MDEQENKTAAEAQSKPVRKAGSRGRISRRLVVTSSAAILAVYAVGFVRTQAAADRVAAAAGQFPTGSATPTAGQAQAAQVAIVATSPAAGGSDAGNADGTPVPTSPVPATSASAGGGLPSNNPPLTVALPPTQPPVAAATTAASTASRYRDGTYSGTGVSRHGDIAAQVTVKGGKIVSTQITGCYTRYPCSRISDLPDAVVGQQSTDIDMVSGATDSSEAFLQAVDNALKKALG